MSDDKEQSWTFEESFLDEPIQRSSHTAEEIKTNLKVVYVDIISTPSEFVRKIIFQNKIFGEKYFFINKFVNKCYISKSI